MPKETSGESIVQQIPEGTYQSLKQHLDQGNPLYINSTNQPFHGYLHHTGETLFLSVRTRGNEGQVHRLRTTVFPNDTATVEEGSFHAKEQHKTRLTTPTEVITVFTKGIQDKKARRSNKPIPGKLL